MSLKRTYLTPKEINRFHPHCNECTKLLTSNSNLVKLRHMSSFAGGQTEEVYLHERCYLKFAEGIVDAPLGPSSPPGSGLVLTQDKVDAAKTAVEELAGV